MARLLSVAVLVLVELGDFVVVVLRLVVDGARVHSLLRNEIVDYANVLRCHVRAGHVVLGFFGIVAGIQKQIPIPISHVLFEDAAQVLMVGPLNVHDLQLCFLAGRRELVPVPHEVVVVLLRVLSVLFVEGGVLDTLRHLLTLVDFLRELGLHLDFVGFLPVMLNHVLGLLHVHLVGLLQFGKHRDSVARLVGVRF